MDEIARTDSREIRGPVAEREQPIGERVGGLETAIVEIVAPSKRAGQPFAGPALEPKRREVERLD